VIILYNRLILLTIIITFTETYNIFLLKQEKLVALPGKYNKEELSWFKEIFDLYYENIRRFVYYKTGDVDLADDMVQDTFLKIWDMRQKINNKTIKALLYTISGNLVKNYFKHRQIKFNFMNEKNINPLSEPADFDLEQEEFRQLLQNTLASLPEKNRMVFLMNRMDKLTYNEIATRLGLSVKAVEKRMGSALETLRRQISYKI
jgi:RNA polymerase sigma-70 factor (family 1)